MAALNPQGLRASALRMVHDAGTPQPGKYDLPVMGQNKLKLLEDLCFSTSLHEASQSL